MASGAPRSVHVPVMFREVVTALRLHPGLTVLDGTVGAGGHAVRILELITKTGLLIGFDRDPMMLNFARQRLNADNAQLVHAGYTEAADRLSALGVAAVDRVLLDLGLSSDQLADRDRGFGFDAGGDLDMRFDQSRGQSLREYLAGVSVDELTDVLQWYGEIRHAKSVAESIVTGRSSGGGLRTVDDLLACLSRGSGRRVDRSTAAPVFQALRIAVNDELTQVETMMSSVLPSVMRTDGIAAVITFHSLEDRIVKQAFRRQHGWQPTKDSPMTATPAEVRLNPRARSAKLRVAEWTGKSDN